MIITVVQTNGNTLWQYLLHFAQILHPVILFQNPTSFSTGLVLQRKSHNVSIKLNHYKALKRLFTQKDVIMSS